MNIEVAMPRCRMTMETKTLLSHETFIDERANSLSTRFGTDKFPGTCVLKRTMGHLDAGNQLSHVEYATGTYVNPHQYTKFSTRNLLVILYRRTIIKFNEISR